MIFDIIVFYMIVGLIVNWGLALVAIYGDDIGEVEVDFMGFFLTIPVWPLTIYSLISSFFGRD